MLELENRELPKEDVAQLSPLMRQYRQIKSEYPDLLVLFRVGDFYELFDADAQLAAKELDITLTGRPEQSYESGRVPMAGVPVRSVDLYLSRLLAKGHSVAICEQVGIVGAEKGPVERRVAKILTPGTVLESHLLPAKESNYLAAVVRSADLWGLAYVEASCGEFYVTQLSEEQLNLELGRLSPSEVLVAKKIVKPGPDDVVAKEVLDIPDSLAGQYRLVGRPEMLFQFEAAQRRIQQLFAVTTLEGFGCQAMPLAVRAAGAIIEYLERNQPADMPKFSGISTYYVDGHLVLDNNTRRNLEITETVRDRSFEGSLLSVLDTTKTAMGSRNLRKWLLKPLFSVPEIESRQMAIQELIDNTSARQIIDKCLTQLADLERLSVKLSSANANPKELLAIAQSISNLPLLSKALEKSTSSYLKALSVVPESLIILGEAIAKAISTEAPRELNEGGIFAVGYSSDVDEIRSLLTGGKNWIEDFQKSEQTRTGIRSLKVSFNRAFGYFIEITHANRLAVPEDYIRKQTLTNAERYITPKLKEYEAKILNAEKHQIELEYKLFVALRQSLVAYGERLLQIARHLANLDTLYALANVAISRNYVRPIVDQSLMLDIKMGKHPVLDKILPMGRYISNDTRLQGDSEDHQFVVLTGPNMSGKSSYLRQVAHIVILAQIGSFVPAASARVGLVDRIFTRIGAVDDLTQGQSTFLVEMSEVTQCCLSASKNSLILLDEVGRGTSTYDGVAIAWSVAEFLAREIRARSIFATHYHELNGLASFIPQIVNYQMMVKEQNGQVQFIRTVVPGGASRSFGVQVARMAGLPSKIIERAELLMRQMERKAAAAKMIEGPKFQNVAMEEVMQLSIFEPAGPRGGLT
jgi:DNA mismatch repair protein MutS